MGNTFLSGGMKVVKYLLLFFNLIIFLAGATLAGLAIWLAVLYQNFQQMSISLAVVNYILIGIGALIMLLGFFGCCGAAMENLCLLYTYSILLILVLVAEIVLAILIFSFKEKTESEIQHMMEEYSTSGSSTDKQEIMKKIENQFNCCGVTGSKYPVSNTCSDPTREGCFTKLKEFMKHNQFVLGGVAIAFGLLEILGVVFACMLARNLQLGYVA